MTAQIFQLIGIAFVTAVAAILVKSTKPELAVVITIAGSIILLLFVLEVFRGSISLFTDIAQATGLDATIVKTLLKMIGIGYLVEFSAGILNDFGQNSLADKLIFCGKILILVLAVPILESILGQKLVRNDEIGTHRTDPRRERSEFIRIADDVRRLAEIARRKFAALVAHEHIQLSAFAHEAGEISQERRLAFARRR